MGSKIYSSPLRVYLFLGALALAGIYSGFRLPVSLFPNSSKPTIQVEIPYGNSTPEEFLNSYGRALEEQLRHINNEGVEVEKVEASYWRRNVDYDIEFKWGVSPTAAHKEVLYVVNSFAARLEQESRDNLSVWLHNENSGFFAVSFFSDARDLDSLYELLEPMLMPAISQIKDADKPILFNPSTKEVRVELLPEVLASLQLLPRDIDTAIRRVVSSYTGGSVTTGAKQLQIEMPRLSPSIHDLERTLIQTPSGRSVHLGDIARVQLAPKTTDSSSFKTNGAASLILYSVPKPGGNVKRMSEEMIQVVRDTMPKLPKDIQYRVLVDPSEFIRGAINNVLHEVAIAALLAVCVLFLFIGSFRNVITAAIEIPMSMVLAFILMRLTGMNLNLISLGGLALSAGMNVDASVVVMENIFRHFEMNPGPHDYKTRQRILTEAVREVQFPIIASTISSLVVFLPLIFTSDLSYAILGDLALTVVFSHGFSAIVALLLVPTVRMQLMSGASREKVHHSPIEPQLKKLENGYANWLGRFIAQPKWKWGVYAGLAALLLGLVTVALPRLPKEIVGVPDTDWMVLGLNTDGNTMLRQMELQSEEIERNLLDEFGDKVAYTFSRAHNPNSGNIMVRLRDKSQMKEVWEAMEKRFTNTPLLRFFVVPWNPSELPIPDPPHVRISVRGGTPEERSITTRDLNNLLEEKKLYPRVWAKPNVSTDKMISLEPHIEQWSALAGSDAKLTPSDLADLVRVATNGRPAGNFPTRGKTEQTPIMLSFPRDYITTPEDIASLPVGIGGKIVPLKSLAEVKRTQGNPTIFRENGQELNLVEAKKNKAEEREAPAALAQAKLAVAEWEKNLPQDDALKRPTVLFEDADKELNEAVYQLSGAVGFSVLLILLTLIVQFGTFIEPLLVLTSIPLGFIGVILSLLIFRSTLSLNSILGVILLNGIAVANSIILVDFIKKLVGDGLAPRDAAVEAARKRLRPILITSLTTVLGMLPIAIGMGEGGGILQPLGIAVSGGLWVSTALTLFLVPALQVSYLEWKNRSSPLPQWRFPKDRFASVYATGRGWILSLNRRRNDSGEVTSIVSLVPEDPK